MTTEDNKIVRCVNCDDKHLFSARIMRLKGSATLYLCPVCRCESYYDKIEDEYIEKAYTEE